MRFKGSRFSLQIDITDRVFLWEFSIQTGTVWVCVTSSRRVRTDIWYAVWIVPWTNSLAHTSPLIERVSFMCAQSWNLSIFYPLVGPMSLPCVALCAVRSHSMIMLLRRAQLSASTIVCYCRVVGVL